MDEDRRSADRRRALIANREEFGDAADSIAWITPQRARWAESERRRRLEGLAGHVVMDARRTKPHLGPLSPGCRICSQGGWSCLFINGACNCRCFYCPGPQDDIGVPTTHRIAFADPVDYADYVAAFGYAGVSISGGEPLLTPQLTLRFLQQVRQTQRRPLHLWMYTNGTRLTADWVDRLRDVGLDEIRFDLSAVDYDLTKVRLAAGRIPCVTVEIPAIPEDVDRVIERLPAMRDAGVNHLNLHQLRLTPHNLAQCRARPYTYLHGDKVTVLESELAALGIMAAAADNAVDLPINYCAFVYKHRYQRAAARANSARFIVKGHEVITANGYIRTLSLRGDARCMAQQAGVLAAAGTDSRLWSVDQRNERLFFHPSLWPHIDFTAGDLRAAYAEAVLCPHVTYRRAFTPVALNPRRTVVVERQAVCPEWSIDGSMREVFARCYLHRPSVSGEAAESPDPFAAYESIQTGLQDYY